MLLSILFNKIGTGYIVYSMNYVMHIEQLTSDYIYSSGVRGKDFSEYFIEAPAMFKRDGLYYVLFGYSLLFSSFFTSFLFLILLYRHCCCFCEQGSGIMVHTASSPLGPYSYLAGDQACIVPFNRFNFLFFVLFGFLSFLFRL